MAPSSEAGPSKPSPTLKSYNIRLSDHISSTRTHFQPDPEELIPSNEWSAEDKQPFYPSLQRHSAHRIDLISKETGKPEDHVRRYLNFLADGARSNPHGGMKRSGRLGKGEWVKGVAPAAREVEEVDILEEERLAAELLAGEQVRHQGKKRKMDETTWGESIDQPKLDALAALIHTSTPADPLAGNKPAKILRDEQTLASMKAIPRKEQTASQQKEIRRLIEKKKMRNRYRMARLIESGMTEQEVKEQGGPDAVYLARSGLDLSAIIPTESPPTPTPASDPLRGNKHAKIIRDEARLSILLSQRTRSTEESLEIRRLTNKKRARQRSRKQKLRQEGMTDQELDDIDVDELFARRAGIPWDVGADQKEKEVLAGMREWVSEKGLDIWGYKAMAERIGDLSTSWEILQQMKTYLVAFLTPVILRAISIAEMEAMDITATHVASALEIRQAQPEPELAKEEELEEPDWEIRTTTTDREEEELDVLLNDVDTAYDIVQEEEPGDWTDPFGVGTRRKGGLEAIALRDEYLRLLSRYSRRKARRDAQKAWTGGKGGKRGARGTDEIISEREISSGGSSSGAEEMELDDEGDEPEAGDDEDEGWSGESEDEDEEGDGDGDGDGEDEQLEKGDEVSTRGEEGDDDEDELDKHDKSDTVLDGKDQEKEDEVDEGNDKDDVDTDEHEWP